ncbi:hypothetical protein N566_25930 [Streptomycetaceae bacterium MP113-05]|nr:hypothetical protein N566_25930 [Streptomycetaceae bacterium MP113-05]
MSAMTSFGRFSFRTSSCVYLSSRPLSVTRSQADSNHPGSSRPSSLVFCVRRSSEACFMTSETVCACEPVLKILPRISLALVLNWLALSPSQCSVTASTAFFNWPCAQSPSPLPSEPTSWS